MEYTEPSLRLTHEGALAVLDAAVHKATETRAPQCIAVVDAAGHMMAFVRMDGAKILSFDSALAKAVTSATSGRPTGQANPDTEMKMAMVTHGKQTNIRGGVPLIAKGKVVGGIGVGSGTLDQDVECAEAGAAVLAN